MKRYLIVFGLILFGLSACTFLFPAQANASIVQVDFEDADHLTVLLRDADESYYITVNGEAYDCEPVADQPGILKCTGPAFEPGEKATLRLYQDDTASKALGSIEFVVPDYGPEIADSDGDGQPDAEDGCPDDPLKFAPGVCGCGTADADSDGDGTPNCIDEFPNDPDRTGDDPSGSDADDDDAGEDADGDGVPDAEDLCQDDPEKSEPGICGCGVPDVDSDGDGALDCEDACPELAYADLIGDPCDKDEDDDGYVDGADQCPYDPNKYTAGDCGCGVIDYDTDGDGTADCIDLCPKDKNKIEPGKCGCGVKDKDSDGDGKVDCKDGCPLDPDKVKPGQCGCGVEDKDKDGDGFADCIDTCPMDCGCAPDGCPASCSVPPTCP